MYIKHIIQLSGGFSTEGQTMELLMANGRGREKNLRCFDGVACWYSSCQGRQIIGNPTC